MIKVLLILVFTSSFAACKSNKNPHNEVTMKNELTYTDTLPYIINKYDERIEKIVKSEAEWKVQLSEMEYYVLREKGTERAFTSPLNSNKESGLYLCAACNTTLFSSGTKFDSGTGWPSFYKPFDSNLIKEDVDYDIGYARTEVMCARCGGHLGHVFEDGPPPTGLRYCINGVSLSFVKAEN